MRISVGDGGTSPAKAQQLATRTFFEIPVLSGGVHLLSVADIVDVLREDIACRALVFYALYLVKTVGITMDCGKTKNDFDDGTVICLAPGQTIGVHRMPDGSVPVAIGLMFHPDLLHGTALAKKMKQFTFFSYRSNEMKRCICPLIKTRNPEVAGLQDSVLFCPFGWWELRESTPRPSACKADALNQLS